MQREQEQLAHAQQSYDDAEPWHLPIGHRPQDSLDTEGLTMASTDTAIPEDNKGYRMLQKMGWKGTGLGRDENGKHIIMSILAMLNLHLHCCCGPLFICIESSGSPDL